MPTDLLDAGMLHKSLVPVCRCGRSRAFAPHGLWWLFIRKRWDDRLAAVRTRFWCSACRLKRGVKVAPVRIDLADYHPFDVHLTYPPESEWKRHCRRRR